MTVELWLEVADVVAVVVGVVLTQSVNSSAPNAFSAELSKAAAASQPTSSFKNPPSMQVTLPVDAPWVYPLSRSRTLPSTTSLAHWVSSMSAMALSKSVKL